MSNTLSAAEIDQMKQLFPIRPIFWEAQQILLSSEDIERLLAERERMEAAKNGAYAERNKLVAAYARMARHLRWPVLVTKTAIEGWEPEWHNCLYIESPAGQLSWHFHDSEMHLLDGLPNADCDVEYARGFAWDGHSTEEKYERLGRVFSPPGAGQ